MSKPDTVEYSVFENVLTTDEKVAAGLRTLQTTSDPKEFMLEAFRLFYKYTDTVSQLADLGTDGMPTIGARADLLNTSVTTAEFVSSLKKPGDLNTFYSPDGPQLAGTPPPGPAGTTGLGVRLFDVGADNTVVKIRDLLTGQFLARPLDILVSIVYVFPNSPAAQAGLRRGDVVTHLNGVPLTRQNAFAMLANWAAYGLGTFPEQPGLMMAFEPKYDSFNVTVARLDESGSLVQFADDLTLTQSLGLHTLPALGIAPSTPIHKVIDHDGKKVGYMLFNTFLYSFDMWAALKELETQGVDELVLDLRYNGGGFGTVCAGLLASIFPEFLGTPFFKYTPNKVIQDSRILQAAFTQANGVTSFETIAAPGREVADFLAQGLFGPNAAQIMQIFNPQSSSLPLNRLYILATDSSGSASDAAILMPRKYGKEIIHVGTSTYGKYDFSLELYGSKFNNHRPEQTHAVTMVGGTYTDEYEDGEGIPPNIVVPEDALDLGELGDAEEPLLKAALQHMSGSQRRLAEHSQPRNPISKIEIRGPLIA